LASWLRHPSLRLLDTRLLEIPRGNREREWARGSVGPAEWILEIRCFRDRSQVQLRVVEGEQADRLSGWTDLQPNEDLVLGMPLADGAGLLLRLPPAGAATGAHKSGVSLPESLAGASPTRPFLTPPALVDGPAQLGRLIKYPPGALRDGLQGTVLVALLVDEQGRVQETNVVRGVRADLDSAAEASLKQALFTPAKDKQGPVSTWVTVPVRFKLAP
jgi:TonB family protein